MTAAVVTAVALWLCGHAVIGVLRPARPRGALELEATALLLGLALVPAVYSSAVILLGPLSPTLVTALLAVTALAGATLLRGNQLRARLALPPEPWSAGQRALLAAVLFFALFAVFAASSAPMRGFDSTFHYAYRGKLLLHEGFGTAAWTDLDGPVGRPITRPAYPLGISALQALVGCVGRGFNEHAARALSALFPLAATGLLFAALRPRGRSQALLAALLFISLPLLYYWRVPHGDPLLAAYGLVFGPEAGAARFGSPEDWGEAVAWCLDGTADLPLAAFLLGGFALLARALSGDGDRVDLVGAGLLLGGAMLAKNEGLPLALAVGLALAALGRGRPFGARVGRALAALFLALLLAAPWLAARGDLPMVDENYMARLSPGNVYAHLHRAPLVVRCFVRAMSDVLLWNLLWPLFLLTVVWSLRRPRELVRSAAAPALLVVALAFALVFTVLLVTPWNLEALYFNGVPARPILHVAPLAILATFSLLFGGREDGATSS